MRNSAYHIPEHLFEKIKQKSDYEKRSIMSIVNEAMDTSTDPRRFIVNKILSLRTDDDFHKKLRTIADKSCEGLKYQMPNKKKVLEGILQEYFDKH